MEIRARQQPFLDFIPSGCPDWLGGLFDLQNQIRSVEFDLIIATRCVSSIEAYLDTVTEEQHIYALLENEMRFRRQDVKTEKKVMNEF